MKLQLTDLIFEVGRKCNMACPHCLRGDAQNVTMPLDIAFKALEDVSSVTTVTFTGGEPMLYAKSIIAIIDYIMEHNIIVCSWFIATNGKKLSMPLLTKLVQFTAYCDEPEMCGLEVSMDMWHEKIAPATVKLLSCFTFFNMRGKDWSEDHLITEGRAAQNGLGTRNAPKTDRFAEMVYINALGKVLPECDWSYERQEAYRGESLVDKRLCDILANADYDEDCIFFESDSKIA